MFSPSSISTHQKEPAREGGERRRDEEFDSDSFSSSDLLLDDEEEEEVEIFENQFAEVDQNLEEVKMRDSSSSSLSEEDLKRIEDEIKTIKDDKDSSS